MAASPLPDGRVLIAGGEDMNPWQTAEVYDPASGRFSTQGVGLMTTPREEAVAAPLPNGDVLIAGGTDARGPLLKSAELFDPASGTFSSAGMGTMTDARDAPAAALLPNGDVLIVGGFDGSSMLSTAELYDPQSREFSDAGVGRMTTGRWAPIAAPLPDGKVLVAGGVDDSGQISATAELFDPATGTFSSAGVGRMTTPRAFATAAPLPNGDVLIAGGISRNGGDPLTSAELFDPKTNTFSSAGVGSMTGARMQAAAAPLPDGDVLIAGGAGAGGELSSAELFTFPRSAAPTGLSGHAVLHVSRDVFRLVVRNGRRVKLRRHLTSTSVLRATPTFTTTPARATLMRGRTVYASGTAVFTRLVLTARRRPGAGMYMLTLRHRYGRSWLATRMRLTIGR
jgi:hypothetical protein